MQSLNPITHCCQHTFDLVVFAFSECEVHTPLMGLYTCSGFYWARIIIEHNTRQKTLDLLRFDFVFNFDFIYFRNMLLR